MVPASIFTKKCPPAAWNHSICTRSWQQAWYVPRVYFVKVVYVRSVCVRVRVIYMCICRYLKSITLHACCDSQRSDGAPRPTWEAETPPAPTAARTHACKYSEIWCQMFIIKAAYSFAHVCTCHVWLCACESGEKYACYCLCFPGMSPELQFQIISLYDYVMHTVSPCLYRWMPNCWAYPDTIVTSSNTSR